MRRGGNVRDRENGCKKHSNQRLLRKRKHIEMKFDRHRGATKVLKKDRTQRSRRESLRAEEAKQAEIIAT